jgi:tRNA-Thr(GGU) m(6)t(6)A37 methyltransferase TsaA
MLTRTIFAALRALGRTIDSIRRVIGIAPPAIPRDPIALVPIGVVRNNVSSPRPEGWEHVRSDIIVQADLGDALRGIESYSHVIVVFALHLVPRSRVEHGVLEPSSDAAVPEQGVLATRSQLRPNSLGVSVVPLIRRRHNIVRVSGLDAINGTPVLDVKPYLPQVDAVPDAAVPPWVKEHFDTGHRDEG